MEDVYWSFARERLKMYRRRLKGKTPVTEDPILAQYRFTNAYRASDRVSQKLIEIQYDPSYSYKGREVIFRTLLFKLFNKLETWELITKNVKPHSKNLPEIRKLLDGQKGLYSAAYIQASPAGAGVQKAMAHLDLLQEMIDENFHRRLKLAGSLQELYELLLTVRSFGPFLAFQYAIDLNYSDLWEFDENEFVVPGPGALDGISKIFPGRQFRSPEAAIQHMVKVAPDNMEGKTLFGRQLHLIDCQNLFCEISKYTRVSHPTIRGVAERTTIKQLYHPRNEPLPKPKFPPFWELGRD